MSELGEVDELEWTTFDRRPPIPVVGRSWSVATRAPMPLLPPAPVVNLEPLPSGLTRLFR